MSSKFPLKCSRPGGALLFLFLYLLLSSSSTPFTQGAGSNNALAAPAGHSHASADETCFICDPSKRDPNRLWCGGHDRYEDRCWMCQPHLEDPDRLYCQEHGLYEDECFLCRPALLDTQELPTETTELFCNEHQVAERECGICQPQRTAELEFGEELKVRFESAQSATKAGLVTNRPQTAMAQSGVKAICEVQYNENELAQITPFAPGIVRQVLVDVGAEVKAGDILVEIHSAEIAAARSSFIAAAVDLDLRQLSFDRERDLAQKKISSEQEVQEAEALFKTAKLKLDTARQRLLNYGLSAGEIARTAENHDGSASLLIRAPFDGTLVQRDVVRGEAVKPGDALFTLTNLSTMWLTLSISAEDSRWLEKDLPVEASLSGLPQDLVFGQLTWINTTIDARTRLVEARAQVSNESGLLKAGMYGDAEILLAPRAPALGVPVSAVQNFEDRTFVFVKHEDDLYALRRIQIGSTDGDLVAVTAGLNGNEPIVVEGAFTAMSEFLKSRLGAGCVHD